MCKVIEDMKNEAVQNKLAPIAVKLFINGGSVGAIAEFFDITVEEVRALLEKKK